MDPKRYILTNDHVIENARAITVRLSDSRTFTARLVGRGPKPDPAVLAIAASGQGIGFSRDHVLAHGATP